MKNMREIVKKGYEDGDYYRQYRLKEQMDSYPLEKKNIDRLMDMLPREAEILDLGCGSGVPFDRYLVQQGFRVTGVDFVQKHIDLAKKSVPDATFILGEISELDMAEKTFDAILSLYTIFHIPREEHKDLLLSIFRMLKRNGLILVTMGTVDEDKDEVGEFIGSRMAWSSYSLDENLRLIEDCGFDIVHWEEEGQLGLPEHHLWILARKIDR